MSEEALTPRVSVLGPRDGELLRAGPVVHRVLEDGSTTEGRARARRVSDAGRLGRPSRSTSTALTTSPSSCSPATSASAAGSTEHVLGPGSTFVAGMGTPHTFGNADPDEPASLLLTVTPERYIGYFRELQDLRPGPDGMLVPAEILALMARYNTEPYSPSSVQPKPRG